MKTFDECFNLFAQVLSQLTAPFGVDADPSEINTIKAYCTLVQFSAGEHFVEPNCSLDNNYFIIDGLVRFYYLTADGKFHNKSFSHENQFAGSIQSSLHDKYQEPAPIRYFIQALEPTTALAFSNDRLAQLYRESLFWANVGRIHGESLALRKQRREEQFLLDSAETRYRTFLKDYPELAGRLPLYHIASYLGITDVALSRIRRHLESVEKNSVSAAATIGQR